MKKINGYIPFARPSIGPEEEEAVCRVLRSGWISTARESEEFEKDFSLALGTKHAMAVNSATAGLHLSLKAAEVPAGTRIITTPYTFTATAEVCRYEGADPLFVDIRESDFNIDPDLFESAARHNRVSAAIPVHIGGLPCDMDTILEVSRHYSFPVIEDAAHALPSKTEKGYAGTRGDMGVFSFYATKPVTTGEGGMIVTENDHYARIISNLRLHGIDRAVWERYQGSSAPAWEYDVTAPGYKYNMNDIAAAIGRIQLGKAEEFLRRRREIARVYLKSFQEEEYLELPAWSDSHCWHLFILRIRENSLGISRDRFMELLGEKNIGTSLHYKPLHLMSYYKKRYNLKPEDYPVSMKVYRSCFSIPIYPSLTDEQVEYIADTIKNIGRSYYMG